MGEQGGKGMFWMIELRGNRVFLLIGGLNLLLAPPAVGILLLLSLRERSAGGLLLAAILSPGVPLGLYLVGSAVRMRVRFLADTVVFKPVFGRAPTVRDEGISPVEV